MGPVSLFEAPSLAKPHTSPRFCVGEPIVSQVPMYLVCPMRYIYIGTYLPMYRYVTEQWQDSGRRWDGHRLIGIGTYDV